MSLINDAILEKLNSLIVVVNPVGKVEYVSPSVKRILGFEPTHLLGNAWWDLTFMDKVEGLANRDLICQQIKQDSMIETVPQERLLKTATGGERWVLWNTSKGPDNRLVGIGHDITDRKKVELKLIEKNTELAQQNKDILDSIQYASRIQEALLPDVKKIKNAFQDAFVYYQPKDVVSGDFYFFFERGNKTFVAGIDCTGHGVPGALMSFIANSLFKEVIVKRGIEEPSEILYALDEELKLVLQKKENQITSSDGMDVAMTVFDFENQVFSYSGAFRPAILIRHNELIEFAPNRFPIGQYGDVRKKFTTQSITIQPNDTVYLFSDGYIDQFGGREESTGKSKKFNKRQFKELLLLVQDMEIEEQEAYLQYVFNNWKQDEPQLDDILVIGIKI
ncbi:MAG: SpoIIE family protein phosphatase [Brumimicrobium sp.]|nr:SpoIIE family protein phosphatase [Brumimicrobium sp.]MCO5269325.1 SpoIIE family protein phosphatase [Brumimicrobium sp.]